MPPFRALKTGGSLTALTVTATLSVSDSTPSLLWICTEAPPLKSWLPWNIRPFRSLLMSVTKPLKVMVASPVPSPVVKLRPVSAPRVRTPLVAVSVTVRLVSLASDTLIALVFPELNTRSVSSLTLWPPGTALTGGASTVRLIVSVSDMAPPEPVFPWSLVTTVIVWAPRTLPLKAMPSRAALMSVRVPVNVIVLSAVPSPTEKLNPVIWLKVRTSAPSLAVSCTWTGFVPASTSEIDTRLPFAELKTRSTLCSAPWVAPGTLFTGASFTALTVIPTVSVSDCAPPEPVLPWSLVVMLNVSAPL